MSRYENYEICKKCGGLCCKSDGCIISPEQFEKFDKKILKRLIYTGFVIIDWYEGDPREDFSNPPKKVEKQILDELDGIPYVDRAYFLRIRNMKDPINGFIHGSWGGQCFLHKRYGKCPIDISRRPYEAAYMEPNRNRINHDPMVRFYATCGKKNFTIKYTKQYISAAWIKYNDVFEEFIEDMFEGKHKPIRFRKKKSLEIYNEVVKYTNFEEETTN